MTLGSPHPRERKVGLLARKGGETESYRRRRVNVKIRTAAYTVISAPKLVPNQCLFSVNE